MILLNQVRVPDMKATTSGRRLAMGIGLLLLFLLTSCQTASDTVTPDRTKRAMPMGAAGVPVPKTLAIFPFENNSVTDPQRYAPLSKGLCAMLITDLNKHDSTLTLIERSKIESLLKEIALSQGGGVDESTAVRVGKILGAQSIAFGAFMVLGYQVRMDVRIINVETSELIISESITGSSDDFMGLESRLAEKIARALRIAFVPKVAGVVTDMRAALAFSKGLEALDQGNRTEAQDWFTKSIQIDPSFQSQVDGVEGLK